MTVFVYVTAIGIIIFTIFIWMLIWAVNSGQWDDLELPPEKVLWDDIHER
jgi:cbb3-type cytochrome oxidase maturation protein